MPLLLLPLLSVLSAPAYDSPAYPTAADYVRIVGRFPRYAERGWHDSYRGDASLGWFGDGHSDENGQRTLANFILAYAYLATQPAYDAAASGVSAATLRDHALAALRYRLRTHVTGDLPCTDGKPWGDHWQSAWWVSRMMPATQLLADRLTAADRAALERVVTHEADRHIGLKPRVGEYLDTKAEENAWDSEVLAWALNCYPDHPHAAGWRAGLDQLCLNTFSLATDAADTTPVDGKPINQWIGGPCVHPDLTIENHDVCHLCYFICPLHSLAWDWYAYAAHGRSAPGVIYHHLAEVWGRTKQFALWQGRFAYVCGKDWPRYAYGEYFILPALVHLEITAHDGDARLLERQRVAAFEREQSTWGDGSFFGGRFTHGQMTGWPSEWESDCAANLAIAALMHRLGGTPHPTSPEVLAAHNIGTLISPYSEFAMRRDPQRFASWSWRSKDGPVSGMTCSDSGEDMLECNGSLAGGVEFAAPLRDERRVLAHGESEPPGGFATAGVVSHGHGAAGVSPWHVVSVPGHVPCRAIVAPQHPIFNQPHRITDITALTDLNTIPELSPAWQPLATDQLGRPSLLETAVDAGRFVVSMTNVEELTVKGDSRARALLENLIAYVGGPGHRCGYIAGESWLRQALDVCGVKYVEVNPLLPATQAKARGLGELSACDTLFIDRSALQLIGHYAAILDFVRRGGRVFESILQQRGWQPDAITDREDAALTQRLAAAALPDAKTLVVLGEWRAATAVTVQSLDLLRWRVANDIFNGSTRSLFSAGEPLTLLGTAGKQPRLLDVGGNWLNVDNDLGLAFIAPGCSLHVEDTPERRAVPSLCLATVRLTPDHLDTRPAPGEVMARYAAVLRAKAAAAATRDLAAQLTPDKLAWSDTGARLVVPGADGASYTIEASFGAMPSARVLKTP
jgi:hypothetical protein